MRRLYSRLMVVVGSVFAATFLPVLIFVYVSTSRQIEQEALAQAEVLNRVAFEALYASMSQGGGREGNRRVIARLQEEMGAFTRLQVIKGDPVIRQFGADPDELPRDELERRALAGEAVQTVRRENGYRVVRQVTPLRVQAECRRCHQAPIGAINGVISTEISLREYEQALQQRQQVVLLSLVSGLLALGLLTFYVLQRLVIRPLRAIHQGAVAIAQGDFSYRLTVHTGDELEALATEFNAMAERLQELYLGLERKVAERTRELALLVAEKEQLYEKEHTQRQLADTLREVSRALGARLKLEEVLQEILFQLGRVLVVDAGLVLLAEGARLTVAAVRDTAGLGLERLSGYSFDAEVSSCLAQVLRDKCLRTFCDPGRRNIFSHWAGRVEDIDWCLVVPLLSGGEVIGLFALERRDKCYEETDEPQIALAFAHHAAVAVTNARLFEQSQKVAMLEERNRLAQDLHDGLAQTLSFLKMKLDAVRAHLSTGQVTQAQAGLARMNQVIGQAYEDLREVMVGLKEMARPGVTLAGLIRERLAALDPDDSLAVHLVTSSDWTEELPPLITVQIANIVQEAVTNVYKHAQARHAWVRLSRQGGEVQIMVEDDGQGMPLDFFQPREGEVMHWDGRPRLGVKNMRARAERMGGQLMILPRPGGGTRIFVRVPLPGSAPPNRVRQRNGRR